MKNRKGIIFVFEGISGSGKGSITSALMKEDGNLNFSISATTREKRPMEEDGVHYHFISDEEFVRLKSEDAFYEFVDNNYGGKKYGTLKSEVDKYLDEGKDVILDIEYLGVCQVRERAGENVVVIGIIPPSIHEIKGRLEKRGDKEEVIKERLQVFEERLGHQLYYDYTIINEDLDNSIERAREIIEAERMKRFRQNWLPSFIEKLQKEAQYLKQN